MNAPTEKDFRAVFHFSSALFVQHFKHNRVVRKCVTVQRETKQMGGQGKKSNMWIKMHTDTTNSHRGTTTVSRFLKKTQQQVRFCFTN